LARKLEETPVRLGLGILQRYVVGEVLRAFFLALLTITAIFVLFMVMAEAAKAGLTPYDIARLVPFIIPSSLPYTMPVALLFSVTVVYGRLAADNEVIAVKTAGLSAMTVLMPAFAVGLVLSLVLLAVANDGIPRATHQAKKIVFGNFEDMFYKVLKKERELNNYSWPFYIKVKDVEGRELIEPIFKHRSGGPTNPSQFDLTVQAKRATITFDLDQDVVRVFLVGSESTGSSAHPDFIFLDQKEMQIPLPSGKWGNIEPTIQEKTRDEMNIEQVDLRKKILNERKRQAVAAALWIGTGRMTRVDWPHIQAAFTDYQRWERKYNALETEKHLRVALACGSLFFVLIGAPVGIMFARRDFLSAFISCFLPIIIIYYPLTLMGVNLGKEGILNPIIALWVGNCVLAVAAGLILPSIYRH
jgi:lipopolysaccharide export system permease protein